MQSKAKTVQEYLAAVPEERQEAFTRLYQTIRDNLPAGFQEGIHYGMIGWVVPHALYPAGYHVNPKQPLLFVALASQKNHIAVYHSGLYSDPELMAWFVRGYAKFSVRKLDAGKSCLRFKKPEQIPIELIAELMRKMTPQDWITLYESKIKSWRKSK